MLRECDILNNYDLLFSCDITLSLDIKFSPGNRLYYHATGHKCHSLYVISIYLDSFPCTTALLLHTFNFLPGLSVFLYVPGDNLIVSLAIS